MTSDSNPLRTTPRQTADADAARHRHHSHRAKWRGNGDTHYEFRHDSGFYYLSGFTEPEAFCTDCSDEPQSILFCAKKIWSAKYGRLSSRPDVAKNNSASMRLSDRAMDEKLTELMATSPPCFIRWVPTLHGISAYSSYALRYKPKHAAHSCAGRDSRCARAASRKCFVQGSSELDIMRRAARFPHRRIAARCNSPARTIEYQIEAELLHEFCKHGARHPPTPHRRGWQKCLRAALHREQRQTKDGDLLLIDALAK